MSDKKCFYSYKYYLYAVMYVNFTEEISVMDFIRDNGMTCYVSSVHDLGNYTGLYHIIFATDDKKKADCCVYDDGYKVITRKKAIELMNMYSLLAGITPHIYRVNDVEH